MWPIARMSRRWRVRWAVLVLLAVGLGGAYLVIVARAARPDATAPAGSPQTQSWLENTKTFQATWRAVLEDQFPETAAAARARYGIAWHEPPPDAPERPDDHAVLLIHGLDEPGKVWRELRPRLLARGVHIAEFTYPNDQAIRPTVRMLRDAEQAFEIHGIRRLNVVAHSMGGLVARDWLVRRDANSSPGPGFRVERLIMIGTPNHGSELVWLRSFTEIRDQLTQAIQGEGVWLNAWFDGAGGAFVDLLPGSEFLNRLNAGPLPEAVDITIVAGRLSPFGPVETPTLNGDENSNGLTPRDARSRLGRLSDGLGDGAVSLASARLEGVDDFVVVEGSHLSMIRNHTTAGDRVPPAVDVVLDRLGLEPASD